MDVIGALKGIYIIKTSPPLRLFTYRDPPNSSLSTCRRWHGNLCKNINSYGNKQLWNCNHYNYILPLKWRYNFIYAPCIYNHYFKIRVSHLSAPTLKNNYKYLDQNVGKCKMFELQKWINGWIKDRLLNISELNWKKGKLELQWIYAINY